METDSKEIWFAAKNNGIITFDGSNFNLLEYQLGSEIMLICMIEFDQKIVLGTSDGVYILDYNMWHKLDVTDGYYINFLNYDRFGNLWIATETGIIRILPSGMAEFLTEDDGLPSRQISSLIFDNEDNIWLTSKRGGLTLLRTSNFTNISTENGLTSKFVNISYQLRSGAIAIGNDNGGVDILENNKIYSLELQTDLTNVSIKDIIQSKDGSIWIATYLGVIRLKDGTESLFNIERGLVSNNTRCLLEDRTGNIWVGAKDGGLVRISPDNSIKIFSIKDGLSDNYVFCIYQLPNGDIITGTYHGGINIISANDEIRVLNISEDDSSPLIFNMEIISNDEYWLATDVGLFKYQNQKFYKISTQKNLNVSTIFDVYPDQYGFLWLTSNLGVLRINKQEINAFIQGEAQEINARLYDEKDGMLSRECTGATKTMVDDIGRLWISTSKGLSIVDPANVLINEKLPPVYIKSVLIDEVKNNTNLESIILEPGSQRLTIDYTALSYYSPDKINFKYRMQGFEKDWNEVGNTYRATYMNLPDGNFKFEVMASNNEGVWNDIPAQINITVDPFFYESRLFYLLLGSFLLLVIFIIYWIRIRVVEEKNRELHKLNSELDSFVYSVSHDLRAPLTSILGLINISKLDKDQSNIISYMGKIESSVNKLDEFIKDIINYSRNARLKVEVEEVDLKLLIKDILDGLAYMNTDSIIEVMIESSSNSIIQSDKTRLQIILNNVISNSFRYYKNYIKDPFIKINIKVTASKAVISISDNGIGIKPDRTGKIFDMFYRASEASKGSGLGLYIAKESIVKLDGTIIVASEFERGTTFTLTVPAL